MKRDWSEARRKVMAEGECRLCSARRDLEAAHIVPRSLGGGMSQFDVVPLCRDCHRAFDEYRVDVLPGLTYAEQAEAVRVLGIERAYRRLAPSVFGPAPNELDPPDEPTTRHLRSVT